MTNPALSMPMTPAALPETGGSPPLRLWQTLLAEAGPGWLADLEGGLLFRTRSFVSVFGDEMTLPARLMTPLREVRDLGCECRGIVEVAGRRWRAVHFPIFDAGGTIVAIGGLLLPGDAPQSGSEDVERAALEASLAEAEARITLLEARLAEGERRKSTLLAAMSHELRTPLNAVVGFSEAALQEVKGPLPPAYREYVELIRGAGRHAGEIVEVLLDAARLEGGQMTLELRPVSARLLVSEARNLVTPKAEGDGIDTTAVTLERDDLLEADALRARQILVNLLTNAIKFTPAGGRVGVDIARPDEGHLDLTVWDTGIGIAPEEQERVFEPFYQVGGAELRAGSGGAGLGLALSRQLARMMGGDILLHSEPGRGSRFTARFRRLSGSSAAR